MNTKILILLLDDLEPHFNKIQEFIRQIVNVDCEMDVDFIYTYKENEQITKYEDGNGYYHKSKYGGSKYVKQSNLHKLNNLLNKIKSSQNVIAVIDINWDSTNDANRYGREFYEDHLRDKILPTNTIFVSFIDETNLGRDLILGFQFVPKIQIASNGNKIELDEAFKSNIKKAICRTKLLAEGTIKEKEDKGLGNNI
jgi:hypothetical protein